VKYTWAVRLPLEKASSVAPLRLRAGIFVYEEQGELWLAGEELSEELELALRKLPAAQRLSVQQDGRLVPIGDRLAKGQIPDVDWQPLSVWITFAPQPAALAGELRRRAPLRLERSEHEEPPSVLVTSLEQWVNFATSAPLVRLRPLQFAACKLTPSRDIPGESRGGGLGMDAPDETASLTLPWGTDEGDQKVASRDNLLVVVRGMPLPPIAGRRYFEREGIAVPCGFRIEPAIDPPILHAILRTAPADLVIFAEDGTYQRVNAADFVAATRSAARATAQALGV
jgi:hypothetical protein